MKKEKKTEVKQKKPKPPAPTIAERANSYACPMALGGVLCFTVVYALYRPYAPLYTILFLLAELGLFMLFDKLKTRRFTGGLIYVAMMLVCVYAALRLSFSGWQYGYMNPVSWFYGEDGSYSYQPDYLNAVFLGGGFFLISILYYFTQIRYRSLGVMLCILFPFVIYAKRAEEMPEIIVTLIITAYLAVMVHNRRIDPALPKEKRGSLVINPSYLISIAIFVSVTGAVTMMIDKPTYRSKLEQDSEYFNYVQTNAVGSGDQEDLQMQSSDRSGSPSYTNRVLFNFETNGELSEYFLRVQSFNNFDGKLWQFNGDRSSFANAYSTIIPEYSTDDIIADIRSLAEQGIAIPEGALSNDSLPSKRMARVHDEEFSPRYLPAPFSTITDTAEFANLKYIKYPQSVILRVRPGSTESPKALDDGFEFYQQDPALYSYAAAVGFTGEQYQQMLENAMAEGYDTGGLLEDYYTAQLQYTSMAGISDRLAQFAYEIVGDAESDYVKASRLESFFEYTGYEYSLEYIPPDDSIDYFVFESKTGYCTNYATAMTLMARAVGLPARYVEGFAAYERTEDGSFVVRDSCAHAFVEVYLPGAGWMTFDPTPPGYMVIPEEDDGFNTAAFLRILSRFLVVIIVAFVLIFVLLLDRIVEMILRIRLRFKAPAQRTLMLYANLIKLVNFSSGADYSAYTVKMLRRYLYETRGTVPEKLLALFERTCFGGYIPTEEEFSQAYAEYKACYKYLRKIPKEKTLVKLRHA